MQYGIISNIHFNDTSAMISQNVLPELQIERQQVTTVPEIEARVIAMENEDISVPDMDCIVLEQTLRDSDWPTLEPD